MLVVVSTHVRIWFTMYYLCICQARVHANKTHEMCGKNMCAHDAHDSRLTFCVYTCALNMHFYVIDVLCIRRLRCKYFQKRVESCSCLMHV